MSLDIRGRAALSRVPELLENISAEARKGYSYHAQALQEDGTLKSVMKDKHPIANPNYALMRVSLAECLTNHVRSADNIDAQFGVKTEAVEFLDDGMAQITYTTADGERKAITTRCVIACDGKNSFVAKQVDERARERPEAYITSNGTGEVAYQSASHDVGVKSVVLDRNFIESLGTESDADGEMPPFVITRIPGSKNKFMPEPFSMFMFPNPQQVISKIGGFLATVLILPGHPIGEVDDVEKAYELFEANFPTLDVRKIISESSMRQFASAKTPLFGSTRRRLSLTCRSSDGNSGVIFLGDSAHSFPPDNGLGVNTAFEDAVVFVDTLTAAGPSSSVDDVMKRYEEERETEITAVIDLHRKTLSQHQYKGGIMSKLLLANILLRKYLSNWLPDIIEPPLGKLLRSEKKFTEVLRKCHVTNQRLAIMVTLVIVGVLGVIFVS